jgi:hypothetical protein
MEDRGLVLALLVLALADSLASNRRYLKISYSKILSRISFLK